MAARRNVLVYPNITYGRNLEADSFVCDLRSILPRLATLRPELHFTILLPAEVESLRGPNVVAMPEWPLPTYPNTMRCHFDTQRFLEILDWKHQSWDAIWSHLPEQTLAIRNVVYNTTDMRPPIVGYSHWVEIPELHRMAADMFPAWLAGVLSMERCGVTTSAMKVVVLERAAGHMSRAALDRLASIIEPQMLGVEPAPNFAWRYPTPGLMIWNHRPHSYTGWPTVLEALDKLWARRQDFTVVCTLDDAAVDDKPYGRPSGLPPASDPGYRMAYFKLLARGWLGLPRLNSHWTWPVAIADGMSVGLPYVVPADYYVDSGDVYPPDYVGQYAGPLELALSDALNWTDARDVAVDQSLVAARRTTWDMRIQPFVDMFDAALANSPRMGDRSVRYDALWQLAASGKLTKDELKRAMGWGVGIPWTPYRNRLLDDGVELDDDAPSEPPEPEVSPKLFD